ncbi:Calcium-independent phospholipase A2-gamma [Cyphellophora attinorum]|uniref:Calcium-independent phospholipase A2-gamma n=1 Tax=Cyphellophora attinorum TaxID=1664694 RepID=A0A0N1HDE3_9EURO|nr:Calcium-independent phospholipase A2-gamma [Phialophora attinorum]KPI42375.1 Calcium-independent phospholipase A2-gamma [Phialophora attinorum]
MASPTDTPSLAAPAAPAAPVANSSSTTTSAHARSLPGAVLLSLDGGGVRGISTLLVLKHVMARVAELEQHAKTNMSPDPRKPKDYFDLAGGTSTGGLIALMLFRLDMNVDTVIRHYDELAAKVFSPTIGPIEIHRWPLGYYIGNGWLKLKKVVGLSGFSGNRLEQAIDTVTSTVSSELASNKGDTPLQGGPGQYGKMLMCATVADKGETMLFRSYAVPPDSKPQSETAKSINHASITIKQACRATSAAPTYLPPMDIGGVEYWDGGLLNNNPVDQVWDARFDLDAAQEQVTRPDGSVEVKYKDPRVLVMLSLGTGICDTKVKRAWYNPMRYIVKLTPEVLTTAGRVLGFSTNTQAKHWDFKVNTIRRNERLDGDERAKTHYFRLNPEVSKEINLDDYKQMKILKKDTEDWLEENGIKANPDEPVPPGEKYDIERLARLLAKTKKLVTESKEGARQDAAGSRSDSAVEVK